MNKLNISLSELLNMLKIAKGHIKKDKAPVLLMKKTFKKKLDIKGSKKGLNPKGDKKKKKEKKTSGQGTYFYYSKIGYWKKNCKVYLAFVKIGAINAPKGVYEIHAILSLSSSDSNSW
uniref:Uncharacterized protein LOC105037317 n=1 Tax=Elaeis guineensis var. tenera TaxID=51953 RepID=A0A6I9QKQ3_ELAGV